MLRLGESPLPRPSCIFPELSWNGRPSSILTPLTEPFELSEPTTEVQPKCAFLKWQRLYNDQCRSPSEIVSLTKRYAQVDVEDQPHSPLTIDERDFRETDDATVAVEIKNRNSRALQLPVPVLAIRTSRERPEEHAEVVVADRVEGLLADRFQFRFVENHTVFPADDIVSCCVGTLLRPSRHRQDSCQGN